MRAPILSDRKRHPGISSQRLTRLQAGGFPKIDGLKVCRFARFALVIRLMLGIIRQTCAGGRASSLHIIFRKNGARMPAHLTPPPPPTPDTAPPKPPDTTRPNATESDTKPPNPFPILPSTHPPDLSAR